MYNILKEAHSGLAYLVLLTLLLSTIIYFLQYAGKKSLRKKSKTLALVTMIIVHLQFLLGIILYFVSPIIQSGFKDFSATMKDPLLRLQILEHPLIMLVVVVFVTLAHKHVKKASLDLSSLTVGAPLLLLFALILALSRIPWSVWMA